MQRGPAMAVVKYRPEIDGLRAVAVVAVVLFHADFRYGSKKLLSGGYIGVDVFFVISGYLIASIIIRELQDDSFRFSSFYERRARRILPAVTFIIASFLPIAWMYLLPHALVEYAKSVVSALVFGSNFFFWNESGYFAESSLLRPFLHTWSLSIEEQFYLVFPLSIVFVWKNARESLGVVLILGILASLSLAQYSSSQHPDANFYLLPTRGWELLVGAWIATQETAGKRPERSNFDRILPPLGLILILLSLLFFNEQIRHPSVLTLVPVLGTAIVIWYGKPGEIVTDVLSSRPFVSIGLVSYSFYLWHFPIFAFSRITYGMNSIEAKVSLALIALLLSCCTYFFVEKPCRNRELIKRGPLLLALLAFIYVLGAIHFYFYSTDGMPERLGQTGNMFKNLQSSDRSPFRADSQSVGIINFGDSHAGALHAALYELALKNNISLSTIEIRGCYPVRGIEMEVDIKRGSGCKGENVESSLDDILKRPPSIIVFSARLPRYIKGTELETAGTQMTDHEAPSQKLAFADGRTPTINNITKALQETINEWTNAGHKIVLVYPVPEMGANVPRAVKKKLDEIPIYARAERIGEVTIGTSWDTYMKRTKETRMILDNIVLPKSSIRIDPSADICRPEKNQCNGLKDEKIVYFDDNHLSLYGAQLIVRQIENRLTSLKNR